MFSEELLELDRNTVEFMIEDMRRQIEEKDEQIKQSEQEIQKMEEARKGQAVRDIRFSDVS